MENLKRMSLGGFLIVRAFQRICIPFEPIFRCLLHFLSIPRFGHVFPNENRHCEGVALYRRMTCTPTCMAFCVWIICPTSAWIVPSLVWFRCRATEFGGGCPIGPEGLIYAVAMVGVSLHIPVQFTCESGKGCLLVVSVL